ncbi:MAG: hypothetical protein P4M08_00425 [Oligoflexia bacterium]|nr:hypothetical protein [Oligoflexia bacterium]
MSKGFITRWLLIALALHLAAAYFSTGYQNSDEHFQVLEFLNAYLGRTPWAALPIEYVRSVRPWFQPFLYWIPVRALMALGISSPFVWAGAIRLVSALIGWASVVSLVSCIPIWIKKVRWQRIAVITLALTWYIPAFHARHSSENLSGALFIIGLCWGARWLANSSSRLSPLLAVGLLWGFAFEARYQVGFMVAGGFFWLALVKRARLSQLAAIVTGILAATAFCTYLDFLGYGHWTFAPWNYFHFNLIEGYASVTDTSPWWDFFRRIWTETWPVLGFICLAGMLVFWALNPWHPLTWTHLPFFLVHVVLAHKETRFLFPLAHAAPLCLVIAIQQLKLRPNLFLRLFTGSVIAMNGVALAAFTFLPAAPTLRFYSKVYDLVEAGTLHELRFSEWDPYTIGGIPMYFYRPSGLVLKPLESPALENSYFYASPSPLDLTMAPRCLTLTRSLPDWHLLSRLHNWTLYACEKN